MYEQVPEISETLEWMFRSRQVGDRTLVQNLVQEQYGALLHFVQTLTDESGQRWEENFTEAVLIEAVEQVQEFPVDVGVQVWLFRNAYQAAQKTGMMNYPKLPETRIIAAVPKADWASAEISTWLDTLPFEKRTVVLLCCVFNFNPCQIAKVIEISELRVAEILSEFDFSVLPEGEKGLNKRERDEYICSALDELWPEINLEKSSENRAVERILRSLREKSRRKQRKVLIFESVLVVAALILVAGMSRLIDLLTPEPSTEIVYRTQVVEQVIYITPTPGPTQPATPFPEKAILYQAVEGETLAEIAQEISLDVVILSALNNLPIDQPLARSQPVMIGVSESREIMPTLASSLPTPLHPQPPEVLLSMTSSDAEIRQRISRTKDYWKSLWADALVIRYGPPGYVGEPEYRRQQIWIDQPYFNFVLDGKNSGEVEFIYSMIGGWENLLQTSSGELLSNVGSQTLNYRPGLHQVLHNDDLENDETGEFELLKVDEVAGRETLVLDWYAGAPKEGNQRLGRFWVDTQYGTTLRVQKYSGASTGHLFEEIIISSIQFDVPIPRRLFDRAEFAQLYFARNYKGDYTREPIVIPDFSETAQEEQGSREVPALPEGYELNQSRLEIQWTKLARFDPGRITTADIFADGFYLGNVEFAEPEQLQCTRSDDGYLLAYSSWPHEIVNGSVPLMWVDLRRIPEVHAFNPDISPYDFVFSPDSQRLAVYGCLRHGEKSCGIYIVDLDSGVERLLKKVEQGAEMIWSPDGDSIAIQGSFLRSGKWRVLVFDTYSGRVTYDGPFDWEGFWVSPDSPIHDWGVQYPPARGGLEFCTLPPNGD